MKTTEQITVTESRLKKALSNKVEPLIMPKITKQITKTKNESKIQIGVMTKFYHYLDKCEVKLNNGNLIVCKILHRFGMELMDFYTPAGDYDFCDTLKEPCIIPRDTLNCLILDVNDNTDEQIMVGYFLSEEIEFFEPPTPGNLKINMLSATNEFWIKFGSNGLDIRSSTQPEFNFGKLDTEMTTIDNVRSDDVYTKAETEELIQKAIDDFKESLEGE